MEGSTCDAPACREELKGEISNLKIGLDKKMDRDGPEGLFSIFQKKIHWALWLPVIILVGTAAWTTAVNVNSSDFKYADKKEVSDFKEETRVSSAETKKDITSIKNNVQTLKTNQENFQKEIREEQKAINTKMDELSKDVKELIKENNQVQQQINEQHYKRLEDLIKSSHKNDSQ